MLDYSFTDETFNKIKRVKIVVSIFIMESIIVQITVNMRWFYIVIAPRVSLLYYSLVFP